MCLGLESYAVLPKKNLTCLPKKEESPHSADRNYVSGFVLTGLMLALIHHFSVNVSVHMDLLSV